MESGTGLLLPLGGHMPPLKSKIDFFNNKFHYFKLIQIMHYISVSILNSIEKLINT